MTRIDEIREQLADQEHDRWARWMNYLFSKSPLLLNGERAIPVDFVKHWQRQIDTPYSELSEKEKDSDRKEADHTLALVKKHIETQDKQLAEGVEIVEDLKKLPHNYDKHTRANEWLKEVKDE